MTNTTDPDLVERVSRCMFNSVSPVWTDDEPVPPELVPDGVDPDDLYDVPITWDVWVKHHCRLDYDTMGDFDADTVRSLAIAAIAEVRAYDLEHGPSEAEIEAVEQSWRGGDGRGETFRESIETVLRAAARARALEQQKGQADE